MPSLPARPDLDQLRRQAKDLLRAAKRGDPDAMARLRAVSGQMILDSARLAVAREHGFAGWSALKTEVDRREILDRCDVARLEVLLAKQPALASTQMRSWCDHPGGASPLGYVAMLRYDITRGVWRDVPGAAAVAAVLLAAGAPVDGEPGDSETPLITAAGYGDAEVARVSSSRPAPTSRPLLADRRRRSRRDRLAARGGLRYDRGRRRPRGGRGDGSRPRGGDRRYHRRVVRWHDEGRSGGRAEDRRRAWTD